MGFRRTSSTAVSKGECIPKGHFAVYTAGGNEKRRFVVPISYLGKPLFQELLSQAEDEFGYHHPMGAITIPCSQDFFLDITSRLSS